MHFFTSLVDLSFHMFLFILFLLSIFLSKFESSCLSSCGEVWPESGQGISAAMEPGNKCSSLKEPFTAALTHSIDTNTLISSNYMCIFTCVQWVSTKWAVPTQRIPLKGIHFLQKCEAQSVCDVSASHRYSSFLLNDGHNVDLLPNKSLTFLCID